MGKEFDEEKKDPEVEKDSEVDGYGYCATDKQRCMQDCNGSPLMSTLN